MRVTLNRQVFLALATIAWADGHFDQSEREGILRAARNSGHNDESIRGLDEAIKTPVSLDSLDLRKLSALDRVFVYACGEWLARIDGAGALILERGSFVEPHELVLWDPTTGASQTLFRPPALGGVQPSPGASAPREPPAEPATVMLFPSPSENHIRSKLCR